MRRLDLVGKVFHKLTVLSEAEKRGKKRTFLCQCECGKRSVAFVSDLTSGKHKSCGCLVVSTHRTHGASYTNEYKSWRAMRQRCNNPNHTNYDRYGGRGIKVCDRWNSSFEAFLEDMGRQPDGKKTIERDDSNGNYEPSNCRWASQSEQTKNRSWSHPAIPRQRDSKGRYV